MGGVSATVTGLSLASGWRLGWGWADGGCGTPGWFQGKEGPQNGPQKARIVPKMWAGPQEPGMVPKTWDGPQKDRMWGGPQELGMVPKAWDCPQEPGVVPKSLGWPLRAREGSQRPVVVLGWLPSRKAPGMVPDSWDLSQTPQENPPYPSCSPNRETSWDRHPRPGTVPKKGISLGCSPRPKMGPKSLGSLPRAQDGPQAGRHPKWSPGARTIPKEPRKVPSPNQGRAFAALPTALSSSVLQAPPQKMAPTPQNLRGAAMGNVWVH